MQHKQALNRVYGRLVTVFCSILEYSIMSETAEKETDTTKSEESANVNIVDEGGVLARMVGTHYRGEERVSSLDLEDPKTKLLLFNAGAARSTSLSELIGKPFKPVDYLAERVLIKVTNKPSRKGCRLTLWTADGQMLFTTSESIVLAFDRMISFFGEDLKAIPQWVLIGQTRTAGGNQWYTVELVDPPSNAKSKK